MDTTGELPENYHNIRDGDGMDGKYGKIRWKMGNMEREMDQKWLNGIRRMKCMGYKFEVGE